ncbi:MAG TPA: S9 family peptidase [Candidatus Saccharimonadales bacterium]|nr:S9 family peptidase [Candidatus Saccharimonadales bacterium]
MPGAPRIILAATLGFISAISLCAQEKSTSQKSVEARLTAQEKPQSPAPLTEVIDTLFATHGFEQAAISPDGEKVAWVETLVGKDGAPNGRTSIFISGRVQPAAPKRISAAPDASARSEGDLAWSPDSKQIAFLSDAAKSGQLQLYVIALAGGPAKKITAVKGFLNTPRFSPDGKTIAILFTENATRAAGPLVAETHETGEIKDSFYEQRLALVDLATRKLRQLSPADTYIYEYDWSPDSRKFVVSSALGNGDNNWWIAELSTLEVASGLMKSIHKPAYQIANPVWSPDGQRIAFIHGLMSDEGLTGGDISVVSATGGDAQNVTPDMKASASWIRWTPESKIIFGEYISGDSGVAVVDPATHKIDQLWRGPERIYTGGTGATLSLAEDARTSAVIRSSLSHPPEVWSGPIGDWKQLTQRNKSIKPAWGEAKSLEWTSDGRQVQGWLTYPRNFDPSKKYPLVVRVHGGPSWAVLSEWPSSHDFALALAGAGYFVLQPNPRGSFGGGESFTRANIRDFGYGDFRDILAGLDAATRAAPIDENRLGLTGWSYGGFMTMWGVTQTKRFKAAVAGAGIANWQSYYGENQIDQWMIPFFGKSVYDDPDVYAKSAPINFIKKAKTPTLVLVGDSDGECPTPQSYEFWHALKTVGTETQLVVYEHEGHSFAKPAHQRDVIERALGWFDAHLK